MGGSKKDYLAAKKCAKHAVYNAKKVAQETRFIEMNTKRTAIKSSNQLKRWKPKNTDVIPKNTDVIGNK